MKSILSFVFILIPFINLNSQPCYTYVVNQIGNVNQCNVNPWVLAFEDDFDGNTLDLSKWAPVEGRNRDGNLESETSWRKSQNIVADNGN